MLSAGPFDLNRLVGDADALSRSFREASPFPHVVVDDCLRLEPAAVDEFPDAQWPYWNQLGHYEPAKMTCQERRLIPEPWGGLIDQLNSPETLSLLEEITGIRKLLPDPYLEGGGLHLSGPGGTLGMHTDFHICA